ncbi:hemin ABC transporter substrate-binding protein [Trueperella sp. LYQ143]|uniref:heme/hemin ABC transporter substrate-binding protein n=1 Tax=Trueperella sp. LYQ143 TaxID=3391059 RepID=UPI003982FB6C
MKKLRAFSLALGASFTLLLTGCGADPTSPPASDNKTSTSTSDGTSTQAQAAESGKSSLPDPARLTGISQVADIGDPVPIEGSFAQKLPVTLTDYEHNSVTVSDTSRILALDINGTLSRTVIALGYGDRLVGRTVSSTEKALQSLPVVTENGHSINTEAIIALNPTVILADRSVGPPESLDQLRAMGIPVVLVDPARSISHTRTLIETVAHALGADEAGKALAQRTESEIASAQEQIAQWTPAQPLDIAFLYVRGTAGIFFILGSEDGAGELITHVGGRDVASEHGITSVAPANAEALVALNPQVIFVMKNGLESTDGLTGLLARPGVAQTRAGEHQRVVVIPDGISLAFGPQTGEILLAVARALYGVDEAQ